MTEFWPTEWQFNVIQRLESELATTRAALVDAGINYEGLLHEAAAFEAEADRLRAALKEIVPDIARVRRGEMDALNVVVLDSVLASIYTVLAADAGLPIHAATWLASLSNPAVGGRE